MICRLCGRERGEPDKFGNYGGPNVCMWTESAECESVRVAYQRAIDAVRDVYDNTPHGHSFSMAEAEAEIARRRGSR